MVVADQVQEAMDSAQHIVRLKPSAVELVDQRLVNPECSLSPLLVYLADHKAKTLQSVVDTLEQFNAEWPSDKVQFLGAAGNAGRFSIGAGLSWKY